MPQSTIYCIYCLKELTEDLFQDYQMHVCGRDLVSILPGGTRHVYQTDVVEFAAVSPSIPPGFARPPVHVIPSQQSLQPRLTLQKTTLVDGKKKRTYFLPGSQVPVPVPVPVPVQKPIPAS